MIQLLITPDMPALTQFVNGLKKRIKNQESAKVLRVGVQIPLPQIIRKLRDNISKGYC